MSRHLLYISLFALLAPGALWAQTAPQPVRPGESARQSEDRYRQCLTMAEGAPDKAINLALDWLANGGGVPARHCEAVALARGGEYGESAIRLEHLIEDMRIGRDMPVVQGVRLTATPDMLADIYSQAANSWLLAGEVGRAYEAIDAALSLAVNGSSQEAALRLDRARIAAADEDFETALQDLGRVIILDPGRQDILIFKASAERALGLFTDAALSLKDFLTVYPNDPAGWLEQGHLDDSRGRRDDALKAYGKAVALDPRGRVGEAARANIERLSVSAPD